MDCEGSVEAGTCLCFFLFEPLCRALQTIESFSTLVTVVTCSPLAACERGWVTNLLLQFVEQIAHCCGIRHFVDLTSMCALQFSETEINKNTSLWRASPNCFIVSVSVCLFTHKSCSFLWSFYHVPETFQENNNLIW